MELYFSPLACSMATRIALYESGRAATFRQVDLKGKRVEHDGSDFLAVNAMGQVPALRTDAGAVLTENPVVLQYVADRDPEHGLAPAPGSEARYVLQQWLNFITTELHKAVFVPLLDRAAPAGVHQYARDKAAQRLAYLDRHLAGHDFLLDRFTIADAYLVTVLNWGRYSGVDLAPYPALAAYFTRLLERPSVKRALTEEFALYEEELKRQEEEKRRGAA
jgi:glutathione S-transferase